MTFHFHTPPIHRCESAIERLRSTPAARGTMVFDLDGFTPSEGTDGPGQLQVWNVSCECGMSAASVVIDSGGDRQSATDVQQLCGMGFEKVASGL